MFVIVFHVGPLIILSSKSIGWIILKYLISSWSEVLDLVRYGETGWYVLIRRLAAAVSRLVAVSKQFRSHSVARLPYLVKVKPANQYTPNCYKLILIGPRVRALYVVFWWSCQWPRYIHIGLCSRPEQRGPFCVFHRTIPYNPQRLYKTAEPNPVNRLGHSRHNPPTPSSQLVNKQSDVQSPAVYREPTFLQTFTKQNGSLGNGPHLDLLLWTQHRHKDAYRLFTTPSASPKLTK